MGDTGAKTAYKIIKGTVDCIILNPLSNQKEIYNRHGVGEYFAQGALISRKFIKFSTICFKIQSIYERQC